VQSFDPDGNSVGASYVQEKSWTEPDGTKVKTLESSTPVKDANGKVIGTKLVEARQETKGGTTKTTVKTTTNVDGKQSVDIQKTETQQPDDECDAACIEEMENEAGGDDYGDPDYIGFNIITPEDYARLEFRIKQVGQPGPDDGLTGEHEFDSGMFGRCWPHCSDDPLVVLMDPDGTAVVADGEPNFNRWVQPDYDPLLQEMAGLANQKVPVTQGDDNPNTDGS